MCMRKIIIFISVCSTLIVYVSFGLWPHRATHTCSGCQQRNGCGAVVQALLHLQSGQRVCHSHTDAHARTQHQPQHPSRIDCVVAAAAAVVDVIIATGFYLCATAKYVAQNRARSLSLSRFAKSHAKHRMCHKRICMLTHGIGGPG